MITKTYAVDGMTCNHCAMSVTEEIEEIGGITEVDVNLPAGKVTVTGESFTDEQISAAVTEAGFTFVG